MVVILVLHRDTSNKDTLVFYSAYYQVLGATNESSKHELRSLAESEVSAVKACEVMLISELNNLLRCEEEIVVEEELRTASLI